MKKVPTTLRGQFPIRIDDIFDQRWSADGRYQRPAALAISDGDDNLLALMCGNFADRLHCGAYNMDGLRRTRDLTMEEFRAFSVRALVFDTVAEAREAKKQLQEEVDAQ
jgi:hypothetical protein